jgi:hypothetical protein
MKPDIEHIWDIITPFYLKMFFLHEIRSFFGTKIACTEKEYLKGCLKLKGRLNENIVFFIQTIRNLSTFLIL